MRRYFTSESVTEGHPDKVCDIISDSILDAILSLDENARVACECTASTGMVLIMGEITTNCYVDIQKIARDAIREIGYTRAKYGFDADNCAIITSIKEQSADIALGVDNSQEYKLSGDKYDLIGAGDQGMMFGYATNETPEYMPLALVLAHKLTKRLSEVRKQGILPYLRPDGKSQVTICYDDDKILGVDTVVVSAQHSDTIDTETLRNDIMTHVIKAVIPENLLMADTKYYINPTGRFETGGPKGDCGLTGRKIIVDTYGGFCPHGGGAFSGKDPTKVDRSAAYMARYAAKNIVAAKLADTCRISLSYAIGVARPLQIFVETFGTGKLSDQALCEIVAKEFDFRPLAIIEKLDLKKPIYAKTASYGHFGRDEFSWEKLDKVEDLKKYLK